MKIFSAISRLERQFRQYNSPDYYIRTLPIDQTTSWSSRSILGDRDYY